MLGDAIPTLEAMRDGHKKNNRISLRAKNGHFVIVKLHTAPLRDERGSNQGAVEIFEESTPILTNRRAKQLAAFGCLDTLIVGGYLMEHGNLRVLLHPAELVIIGGAAIGTVLIANSLSILKKIIGGLIGVFGGSKFGKARYMEIMKMLYELFSRARKEGLTALETDSDNPEQSPVLSKHPKFLKDHHVLYFVCDTVRMAAGGGVELFDIDEMMELDMDVHHHDAT